MSIPILWRWCVNVGGCVVFSYFFRRISHIRGEQALFLYAVALTILRCKNTQRAFAKAIADQKAGGSPPELPQFFYYQSMFSTEPCLLVGGEEQQKTVQFGLFVRCELCEWCEWCEWCERYCRSWQWVILLYFFWVTVCLAQCMMVKLVLKLYIVLCLFLVLT